MNLLASSVDSNTKMGLTASGSSALVAHYVVEALTYLAELLSVTVPAASSVESVNALVLTIGWVAVVAGIGRKLVVKLQNKISK